MFVAERPWRPRNDRTRQTRVRRSGSCSDRAEPRPRAGSPGVELRVGHADGHRLLDRPEVVAGHRAVGASGHVHRFDDPTVVDTVDRQPVAGLVGLNLGVAVIEGLLTGFIVQFLASVRPDLVGLDDRDTQEEPTGVTA